MRLWIDSDFYRKTKWLLHFRFGKLSLDCKKLRILEDSERGFLFNCYFILGTVYVHNVVGKDFVS